MKDLYIVEGVLEPCVREGNANDWWGPQHKHCTGAAYVSETIRAKCSCSCHSASVKLDRRADE